MAFKCFLMIYKSFRLTICDWMIRGFSVAVKLVLLQKLLKFIWFEAAINARNYGGDLKCADEDAWCRDKNFTLMWKDPT